MKKALTLLLITVVGSATIFASGAQEMEEGGGEQEQILMRLAETHPQHYPTTQGVDEFARLVEERTGGRIKIEVYHSSQLGEEQAVIEQVQLGDIDFARVSIPPLAPFASRLNALQMPYLYRDADHMWKVLRGEIGDEILASLESSNFVGLAWYDAGSRSFYNSVREITNVEEMNGLKFRVQESEFMVGLVEALGAVATPMPLGEVYSALQTGVIDGAENNWASYYSMSHYEVAGYYTLDQHTRVPEILVASKMSMDRLSQTDQEIIKQAARESVDYQIERWASFAQVAEEAVRAKGNTITELSPDAYADFQAAVQPLYDNLSPELRQLVREIRAVR